MASTDTAFEFVELDMQVSLPPSYSSKVKQGVHEILNDHLMKYNDNVGGVLCSYSHVGIPRSGLVVGSIPFIHFFVAVKGLVFRPQRGQRLVGVVNKIGTNHIGLLIAGTFNASISSDHMASRFAFDQASQSWKGRQKGTDTLEVGSSVTFTVLSFHEAMGLISVVGSLDELPSVAVDNHAVDNRKRRRPSNASAGSGNGAEEARQRKKSRSGRGVDAAQAVTSAPSSAAKKKKAKKKKKKKKGKARADASP